MEEEDFAAVQEAYKMIENTGVQVIVQWEGEEKLYQEVRKQYDREGLTPGLMQRAGPHYGVQFPERFGPETLRTLVLSHPGRKGGEGGGRILSFRPP